MFYLLLKTIVLLSLFSFTCVNICLIYLSSLILGIYITVKSSHWIDHFIIIIFFVLKIVFDLFTFFFPDISTAILTFLDHFLVTIFMDDIFLPLHFLPLCVLISNVNPFTQHIAGFCILTYLPYYVFLIGEFNLFTFKVLIGEDLTLLFFSLSCSVCIFCSHLPLLLFLLFDNFGKWIALDLFSLSFVYWLQAFFFVVTLSIKYFAVIITEVDNNFHHKLLFFLTNPNTVCFCSQNLLLLKSCIH